MFARVIDAWLAWLELVCLESSVTLDVKRAMLRLRDQFHVGQIIVALVFISVMNVISPGNRAVRCLPYIPVEVGSPFVRSSVVAVGPTSIPMAIPFDERQRFDCSHGPGSFSEYLVDRLPCHLKSRCHLAQAEPLLVKVVHLVGFGVVSVCWHSQRITHVNRSRLLQR